VVKEAIEEDLAEGYREMDARELRKLSQVRLLFV
jgi:malate dehydrogenase (decarboxylating)